MTECVCKLPYYKKQMSASADFANFRMNVPFLILGEHSFKPGHLLNFLGVNRGAHSKGEFI